MIFANGVSNKTEIIKKRATEYAMYDESVVDLDFLLIGTGVIGG